MTGRGQLNVVVPIYPAVDLLDVAAPSELFSWVESYSSEVTCRVWLVAATARTVSTRNGTRLVPHTSFAGWRRSGRRTDLLWVPGGATNALSREMVNERFLDFLRARAAEASWVTSVCEGALLLAAAGLLDGYRATTHWAFIPCLAAYPAIRVASGHPRFVVDRNRVTGGGISAGLDESLELIKRIAGQDVAESVQQVTQYYPHPPVHSEIPPAGACPLDAGG